MVYRELRTNRKCSDAFINNGFEWFTVKLERNSKCCDAEIFIHNASD